MGEYKSPPVGNDISCVMFGLSNDILTNRERFETLLTKALRPDGLTVEGVSGHDFPGGGYTATMVLSESHVAVHTYPEYGTMTFDLYSCLSQDSGNKTLDYLIEKMNPTGGFRFDHPVPIDPNAIDDKMKAILKIAGAKCFVGKKKSAEKVLSRK